MNYRCVAFLGFGFASALAYAANPSDIEHQNFFENEVRPLLAANCVSCHGEDKQEGDLRLDSLAMMLQGGESGQAVVPGQVDESLLVEAINYDSFEMPPSKQLGDQAIEVLTRWVEMGAPWPSDKEHLIRPSQKEFTQEDRDWWAIQPVADPSVPNCGDGWAVNEIDRFIARKLESEGLEPAAEASRIELVRRAYFDLHGLPPTPDQVNAFVNDDRPDAWPRLIRELLDSPRYGERWAQHWLDVVRFAESDGYNEDAFRPSAGKFRDYVIASLNDDKPYRQLVREHLAGDEIAPNDPDVFIGTGYLRHGVYEWNQRNAVMQWDLIVNEMTRVTGEAFLGIGIGCAQCHDHKFDPILQKDYFGLQAFLSSVAWPLKRELATKEEIEAYRQKFAAWEDATAEIRDEIHSLAKERFDADQKYTVEQFPPDVQAIYFKPEAEKTTYEKQVSYLVERQAQRAASKFDYAKELKKDSEKLARYQELETQLKQFDAIKPDPLPDAFVATDVSCEPAPTYLMTRTTKEAVEPSFLALMNEPPPTITPTQMTTGRRTALADWIVRDENPLSTRVIVNRIWQRHFGTGIVPTPNDFGTLGELPSHPELLDWLTQRFIESGWTLKPLHELMMNSAAYRQTAHREPTSLENELDPENRLLWRYPPQRLDAEQVRDAMLAVSGELKHRNGGASVAGTSPYRSVYVKKLRNKPDEMLCGFDAPLGFESAPNRTSTTTPVQSLLLVNGAWTLSRAETFAKRLLAGKDKFEDDNVRMAYRLAYGRDATDSEISDAIGFVRQQASLVNAPQVEDKYPGETGLRPVSQYFAAFQDRSVGENALWVQPGSRFERLHLQGSIELSDEFTVKTITVLDRLYPDASVNTLLSRWNGSTKSEGWSIGVTSQKSAYQPGSLIVQLVGRTFQDEPKYEVVASGLKFPLGKPVQVSVTISASTSEDNPTNGKVTFSLHDLSNPNAQPETVVVDTAVVSGIQNTKSKLILGGRDANGHQWDGQFANLSVDREDGKGLLIDLAFKGTDGERPAPDTAWLRRMEPKSTDISAKTLSAVTSFCHALFNSNEFLYLH
ncbi:Planctomycete cytochrome C [Rubripirellula amarantea]|uniref:Planctomycete cytochrome C n=1 Tax=Rubripirellula amarantea TaxID=2527999 RepID=A0A5C5WSD2_9BACT|nr:PSD1 and planctomycete cytochrome C domain-containing protein [Rubripirellula amarantea]TWT53071.1 Planctomycete cytochrome C [Rubripirellula amarantea]